MPILVYCCAFTVAVGAHHITLVDLFLHSPDRPVVDGATNVDLLTVEVIKFQYDWVFLPAIDARVLEQVLVQPLPTLTPTSQSLLLLASPES